MKSLRLWIFLLLSLALPINGMAHLLMPAEPCTLHGSPMPSPSAPAAHAAMQQHAVGAQLAAVDACCEQMAPGDDGQPCKSGLDCKTGGLLQVGASKAALPLIAAPGTFPLSFAPLPGTSEAPWHPPRA